jgi:hypothetical protein
MDKPFLLITFAAVAITFTFCFGISGAMAQVNNPIQIQRDECRQAAQDVLKNQMDAANASMNNPTVPVKWKAQFLNQMIYKFARLNDMCGQSDQPTNDTNKELFVRQDNQTIADNSSGPTRASIGQNLTITCPSGTYLTSNYTCGQYQQPLPDKTATKTKLNMQSQTTIVCSFYKPSLSLVIITRMLTNY